MTNEELAMQLSLLGYVRNDQVNHGKSIFTLDGLKITIFWPPGGKILIQVKGNWCSRAPCDVLDKVDSIRKEINK